MLKYFICPDGQKHLISDCIKPGGCRLPSRCEPITFLLLASKVREWNGSPSTTQLISGTRCEYLKIVKDYAEKPNAMTYAILGTLGHAMLESVLPDLTKLGYKYIAEERLKYRNITGQMDLLINENNEWNLVDYKTSGSYKVAKALGVVVSYKPRLDRFGKQILRLGKKMWTKIFTRTDKRDIFEWNLQQNLYRFLIQHNHPDIKIDNMFIYAIPRDGNTSVALDRGIEEKTYMIRLDEMTKKETFDYFIKKRDALVSAIKNNEMPEKCNAIENWNGRKCKSCCPVSKWCK